MLLKHCLKHVMESLMLSKKFNVNNLNINSTMIFYFSFIILVFISAKISIDLLDYREWGDESETIVTAKMMASGQLLYSEIFNHHGPLTFLPAYFLEKIGNFGVPGHRVIVRFLQIILLFCVFLSGSKNIIWKCLYVSILMVSFWGLGPHILANTYQYQTLTGISLFSILYFFTLPTLNKLPVSRFIVIFNGILISFLSFISITNSPMAFLLILASITKENKRNLFLGLLLGGLFLFFFMAETSSFKGYLAYHIYLNSQILPLYNGGQSFVQLIEKSLSGVSSSLTNIIIFSTCIIGLLKVNNLKWYRIILILAGLCSLLIRAEPLSFHGVPYMYSFLAILACFKFYFDNKSMPIFLMIILILIMSNLIYNGKYSKKVILKHNRFSDMVQSLTGKDDKIIAYSFVNYFYILADRLPASAHFFYLPWQEKYQENPVLGISNNICDDINKNKPKLMYINKWKVWGRFSWSSYAPDCFKEIIKNDYNVLHRGGPIYLINELFYDLFKVVDKIDIENNLVTNYVNDIDLFNGNIQPDGNDPYISYIVNHRLQNNKSNLVGLYLDINFFDSKKHPIQLYYAQAGMPYTESNSIIIDLSTNKYTIDIKSLIGLSDDIVIDKIRLDFDKSTQKAMIEKIAYY